MNNLFHLLGAIAISWLVIVFAYGYFERRQRDYWNAEEKGYKYRNATRKDYK